MKRILLIVFVLEVMVCTSYAQKAIVINAANTQINAGTFHYKSASISNFVVPKADTNHAWNYANLVFNSDSAITYISNPFLFSGSSSAIAEIGETENITSVSLAPTNYVFDEDSLSIYHAGNFVTAQNFSLFDYFTNQKDSLYVPQQADYCRLNILNFPTSAKSVFKRNAVRALNFSITVTSEGYKKASGTKYTYFSTKDTVMGWGSLKIPSTFKSSIPYNVLLIKRKTVAVDSFYISKKVPNPIYLTALGMIQGKKTITCEQFFYRAGYANPIMAINYGKDTTYSTPISVIYATDSVKSDVRIDEKLQENFIMYPNPTSEGLVSCRFTKSVAKPWKLVIINTLGQVLASQNIDGIGEMNLQIKTGMLKNSGIYYVNIIDENGQKTASDKLSVVR